MRLLGRSYSFRFRQLVSTSLLGLAVLYASPAPVRAADATARADGVSSVYLSFTGGYLFNASQDNFSVDPTDDKVGNLNSLQPGSDAWFTAIAMGQRFDSQWDWRASAQSIISSDSDSSASPPNVQNTEQWASNELSLVALDFEAGYHPQLIDGMDLRLYAGPRAVFAKNDISYGYRDIDDNKLGRYEHDNTVSAIGPRVGIDALIALQEDGPRLALSGSGSMLFGNYENDFNYHESPGGSGGSNTSDTGTVYNLEGSAAIQFDVLSNATLEVGYRAQQWWNLLESVEDAQSGTGGYGGGRKDVFVHGPFATFSLKLGSGQ